MYSSEVKDFIKNIESLPTIPILMKRIHSLMQKEDCSLKDLNRLVTHDQALAERVIRAANSAFFGHSGQIRDICQAILFLGFERIKSLAIGMSVISVFPQSNAFNLKHLWIHSYEVAMIASVISGHVSLTSPPECFLSGLLHDIGRILFYKMDPHLFLKILTTDDMIEKEREFFGCTHAESGAWFAENAGLPLEIILTIKDHHHPSKAQEFRDIISIVALAEAFSRMYSPRIEDDGIWSTEHDALLLELGIENKELADIGQKLNWARLESESFFAS